MPIFRSDSDLSEEEKLAIQEGFKRNTERLARAEGIYSSTLHDSWSRIAVWIELGAPNGPPVEWDELNVASLADEERRVWAVFYPGAVGGERIGLRAAAGDKDRTLFPTFFEIATTGARVVFECAYVPDEKHRQWTSWVEQEGSAGEYSLVLLRGAEELFRAALPPCTDGRVAIPADVVDSADRFIVVLKI